MNYAEGEAGGEADIRYGENSNETNHASKAKYDWPAIWLAGEFEDRGDNSQQSNGEK